MIYRNEVKHEINAGDKAAIIANLRAVASPDPHVGKDGRYLIRSLYFDNLYDKALREKIDGVNEREKFRLLYPAGKEGEARGTGLQGIRPADRAGGAAHCGWRHAMDGDQRPRADH